MDSIKALITVLCAHLPAENQNPQSFYAFIEDRLASFEDILFSYCFGEEVCGEERKTKRIRHIDIRQTGTSAFVFHWIKTIILVQKIV